MLRSVSVRGGIGPHRVTPDGGRAGEKPPGPVGGVGYRHRHAVPLTPATAPGPPAHPPHARLGAAGRHRAALPAVRAAVRRLRVVRCADLRAVRDLVRGRAASPRCPPGRWPTDSGRRSALVGAGVLQAGRLRRLDRRGPTFAGFAAGFVLWGIGGTLVSGAQEALLYDGLAAVGAEAEYPRINGWVHAAVLLAAAAGRGGGHGAVRGRRIRAGRLGECRASAWPRPRWRPGYRSPPAPATSPRTSPATWPRCAPGWRRRRPGPGYRRALLAAALVGGFDAIEEYFPLITEGLGVPTVAVPLAMLPISLAGALGATLGGPASRLRRGRAGRAAGRRRCCCSGWPGWSGHPAGVAAVALFYLAYPRHAGRRRRPAPGAHREPVPGHRDVGRPGWASRWPPSPSTRRGRSASSPRWLPSGRCSPPRSRGCCASSVPPSAAGVTITWCGDAGPPNAAIATGSRNVIRNEGYSPRS